MRKCSPKFPPISRAPASQTQYSPGPETRPRTSSSDKASAASPPAQSRNSVRAAKHLRLQRPLKKPRATSSPQSEKCTQPRQLNWQQGSDFLAIILRPFIAQSEG